MTFSTQHNIFIREEKSSLQESGFLQLEKNPRLPLSIIAYNARSLKNTINANCLRNFINSENPDTVLLCETWLENDFLIYHTGYKQFRSLNNKYGGSMIIVNSHKFTPMQISVPSQLKNHVVSVILLDNKGQIAILISYYSQPNKEKSKRDELFEIYATWISKRYSSLPIIIYSDFNVNFNDKRIHKYPGRNAGFTLLKSNKSFTREQLKNNKFIRSYLDVITAKFVKCKNAAIGGHPGQSDHLVLRYSFELPLAYFPPKPKMQLNLGKIKSQVQLIKLKLCSSNTLSKQTIIETTDAIKSRILTKINFRSLLKDINAVHEQFESDVPLSSCQSLKIQHKIYKIYSIMRNEALSLINQGIMHNSRTAFQTLEKLVKLKSGKGIVQLLKKNDEVLNDEEKYIEIVSYFSKLFSKSSKMRITDYITNFSTKPFIPIFSLIGIQLKTNFKEIKLLAMT